MSEELKPYIVLYTNEDTPTPEAYIFQAVDAKHAIEQFHSEDPTGKLVWVGPDNTEEAAREVGYYQKYEPAEPVSEATQDSCALKPYTIVYTDSVFVIPETKTVRAVNSEEASRLFMEDYCNAMPGVDDPALKILAVVETDSPSVALEYHQHQTKMTDPAPEATTINDAVLTTSLFVTDLNLKHIRSESNAPCTFRYARYPNGELRIQGGYVWQEGWQSGITWRDLPIIDVDHEGNEIQ